MKLFSYNYATQKDIGEWQFWFRIHGPGLCFSNEKPSFSERYGYIKPLRVFGVKIEYLPQMPPKP